MVYKTNLSRAKASQKSLAKAEINLTKPCASHFWALSTCTGIDGIQSWIPHQTQVCKRFKLLFEKFVDKNVKVGEALLPHLSL